jgi:23S rRNA (cytosine1962-C5)-methyltransferase
MTLPSYPVVRLRPKAEARAIRHGFPWVYADELVTDRRTKALAPGALAVLEDTERRALGLVTVNPARRSSRGCLTATRARCWTAPGARRG